MIIGETDDYFYFTIALKEGCLKNKYSVTINEESAIFEYLKKLMKGFKLIDVFEEGSPERKSLEFEKRKGAIEIAFNLTDEERVFYTIEFANLRRLGDTRFKNIVKDKGAFDVEDEREFRYKFKVRLHNLLDDLERQYANQQNNVKN